MSARFDLQSHSVCSDGELSAAEVVAAAAGAGIEVLALSDHDTVDGVAEALAAGREHGVGIVPAIEISALDPEGSDLHILGYGIDHEDAGFGVALERFRADRGQRADRMIAALRECGFQLDTAPLERRRADGGSIGRPHLAEAVFAHPANAERIAAEGLAHPSAVLEAYLLPGTPAFRARSVPTVADAVTAIHRAGGLAVWAHPFWDVDAPEEVVATLERFKQLGIDGVEAFYTTFDEPQTRLLAETAARLGLLTTGSADFHGPGHDRFNRFGSFSTYGLEPDVGRVLAMAA
ncbi:MAG: PHP domain-containing protein [Baekduia sp.]